MLNVVSPDRLTRKSIRRLLLPKQNSTGETRYPLDLQFSPILLSWGKSWTKFFVRSSTWKLVRSMIDRFETSAIVLISRSLSAFVIKALLLLQISSRVVVHVCVRVSSSRIATKRFWTKRGNELNAKFKYLKSDISGGGSEAGSITARLMQFSCHSNRSKHTGAAITAKLIALSLITPIVINYYYRAQFESGGDSDPTWQLSRSYYWNYSKREKREIQVVY